MDSQYRKYELTQSNVLNTKTTRFIDKYIILKHYFSSPQCTPFMNNINSTFSTESLYILFVLCKGIAFYVDF